MSAAAIDRWDPASPGDAAAWFANVAAPWWIAGGWAIDIFLDRETRPHEDLDVSVLRPDVGQLIGSIPDFEVFEAKNGELSYLSDTSPRRDVNSLWCRVRGTQRWKLEIMLDECRDGLWVYRRDPEIRRDLASVIRKSRLGIPYLAPEVQLLYKAKHARARDQQDFEAVAPQLAEDARNWLRQCLQRTLPSHPWIGMLERHRPI
ncbi:MAG: hypothetical protein QM766_01090 [Burkholderiaceae bacterium]